MKTHSVIYRSWNDCCYLHYKQLKNKYICESAGRSDKNLCFSSLLIWKTVLLLTRPPTEVVRRIPWNTQKHLHENVPKVNNGENCCSSLLTEALVLVHWWEVLDITTTRDVCFQGVFLPVRPWLTGSKHWGDSAFLYDVFQGCCQMPLWRNTLRDLVMGLIFLV